MLKEVENVKRLLIKPCEPKQPYSYLLTCHWKFKWVLLLIKFKIVNYQDKVLYRIWKLEFFKFFSSWLGISHVKNFSLFLEYIHKKIRITPSPSPYPHPSIMKAVSKIYTAVNSIQSERKYHTSLTSHNFITLSSLLLNFIRQSSKLFKARFFRTATLYHGSGISPCFLVWRGRDYMDTSLHPKVKVDSAFFYGGMLIFVLSDFIGRFRD